MATITCPRCHQPFDAVGPDGYKCWPCNLTLRRNGGQPSDLSIADVEATFGRWLLLADTLVVRVALAATIAHRLGLDPVWLMIVKPPGAGKTEIINSLQKISGTYPLSSLTPQTLASGRRIKGQTENFSLLERLPPATTLLLKDFTTILSLHRESRGEILSQLREVADGAYHKEFGNGVIVDWKGQLGFVAGCTEALDRHHAVTQVLGERYLQFRPAAEDERQMTERSMRNTGREAEMREDLANTMAAFANGLLLPEATNIILPDKIGAALTHLAPLVARARTPTFRDAYRREIEYIPQPESPGRLGKQLASMAMAFAVLEGRMDVNTEDYERTLRVGLDSMPRDRRAILNSLVNMDGNATTANIATGISYPTDTTRRLLEDMTAMGLAHQAGEGGRGTAYEWGPSDLLLHRWAEIRTPVDIDAVKSTGEGIREI